MTTDLGNVDLGASQSVEVSQPVEEKMIPQSKVNELISKGYHQGAEKGYQRALTETMEKVNPQSSLSNNAAPSSPDDVRKIIAEELSRERESLRQEALRSQQEQNAQKMMSELAVKVKDAEARYDDFHEVTKDIDFSEIPQVLHYSNMVDNGGDVLYELSKNPGKMGSILSLPQNLAVKAIKELSSSIKMNQSASRSNEPAPLSHTKPSYSGLAAGREGSKSGNGPETHTIADLKALKARYRS